MKEYIQIILKGLKEAFYLKSESDAKYLNKKDYIQPDWEESSELSAAYIKNKPEIANIGQYGTGFKAEIFNSYQDNTASGNYSHAEGGSTEASGNYSHAEGYETTAYGDYSHAEGRFSRSSGEYSHAEGYRTGASGMYSHAEGQETTASGESSHAEGNITTASGYLSHAEGFDTTASHQCSHAEGYITTASGINSHAEGSNTIASGTDSHAEGFYTTTSGNASHVEGSNTISNTYAQHVQGEYNILDEGLYAYNRGKYAHIVGNGTSEDSRSNAHTLDWEGNAWYQGNAYVGGTSQDDADRLVGYNELNNRYLIPIRDSVTDMLYVIAIKEGQMVSRSIAKSIAVTTPPTNTSIIKGTVLDTAGMVATATLEDGSSVVIENMFLDEAIAMSDTVTITYRELDRVLTADLEVDMIPMDELLIDFNYTEQTDGNYYITEWKGTLNGEDSDTIEIPSCPLIII